MWRAAMIDGPGPVRWAAGVVMESLRYLRTHVVHLLLAPVMAVTGVTLLHELAHAAAVWIQGGYVSELSFLPSAHDFGHVRYAFPPG